MKKLIQYIAFTAIISFAQPGFTIDVYSSNTTPKEDPTSAHVFQKIIEEYKKYLASVPAPVRKEITEFRTNIAKLQKEKRDLYKQLSVEAQAYLHEEEKYRDKLPAGKTGEIDLQQQKAVKIEQSNK